MNDRQLHELVLALLFLAIGAAARADERIPATKERHPAAALWLDPQTLAVACERSDSIAIVDTSKRRIVSELDVGGAPSAIAVVPDGRILVTDAARHRLLVLERHEDSLHVQAEHAVPEYPSDVVAAPDGQRAYVASLWSHQVSEVRLGASTRIAAANSDKPDNEAAQATRSLTLPFCPGHLLLLPGGKLLVADAFGGQLATIDLEGWRLGPIVELDGHSLTNLALDPTSKRMWLAHGWLNQKSPIDRAGVEQGSVLRSLLRSAPIEGDPAAELSKSAPKNLSALGSAAADPTSVTVLDANHLAITLSGTDQVAIFDTVASTMVRFDVGAHPVAAALAPSGGELAVINALDNTVSLLDWRSGQVEFVRLSSHVADAAAERGERLFFDARLSARASMSCHTCHTNGHTNGKNADTLGDGNYGTPKRVLTLRGVRMTDPWAWSGQVPDLHQQVRKSLESTMHADHAGAADVYDLVAYLFTLAPPPPVEPERTSADAVQIARGAAVFAHKGCATCHVPPLTYTSHDAFDVGMPDARGLARFNPPSLLGVSQQPRYFHDGRAPTLESIFDTYAHPGNTQLSAEELADLLRFVRSL